MLAALSVYLSLFRASKEALIAAVIRYFLLQSISEPYSFSSARKLIACAQQSRCGDKVLPLGRIYGDIGGRRVLVSTTNT